MGASRKLQGEIDRVLKKVQEGVDVFDSIWNKVYDTENANQKEKFEADLKKEIKKLQRYRDQIKTWIQSSEIKDKKALLDARKLIEREMERFKVCEKETKTKAFSKEGLGQQPKTDPKEKAKSETRDWLNNMVSELESQIDVFEADIEGLSVKKGKTRPARLTHLEEAISRHKAHISKLELILRLLDNDELSPEQVNDVKDFVEDYVERNQDDFDDFADVDELYNQLPLDKVEGLEDLVVSVPPSVVLKEKAVIAAAAGVPVLNGTSLKVSLVGTTSQAVSSPGSATPQGNNSHDQVDDTASQESSSDSRPRTPPSSTIASAGGSLSSASSSVTAAVPNVGMNSGMGGGSTVLARGLGGASASALLAGAGSNRSIAETSTTVIPTSPISLVTPGKEDDGSAFPGRRVTSDVGLQRGVGRGSVVSGVGPGQTTPLVPLNIGGAAHSGSGLSPDIAKRPGLAVEDRVGSSGLTQQLASPLSGQSRVYLQQGPKIPDGTVVNDSNTVSEGGLIGTRIFNPSSVPGGQWRPPSASSFQNQTETGQYRGRAEIAPDQREKFLQRLQQVQQQGHSAALLGGAQLSHLTVPNQKQFSSQQQTTLLQQAQLQILQQQHQQQAPLLQNSQGPSLQQQQVGMGLGLQSQSMPAANSASQQHQQVQSSAASSAGAQVLSATMTLKENDFLNLFQTDVSSGKVEDQQLQQQQKDESHDITTVHSGFGRNFANEDDLKNSYTFDVPVGGPGSLAELSQLSRDADLAPGQPVQSSLGHGVIGRRSNSDLGAIGDNLVGSIGSGSGVHDHIHNVQMLEAAYHKLPQPKDSERLRSYVPRHPAVTPPSYPQVQAPIIDNPSFWAQLDTDTLFFAFYYQQNTYQQYLAARELKKQSWRYHRKYNTWFQRHEEPKVTTDEYEQGTYVYFDFNIMHEDYKHGWCQRIKTEFTFEYAYLEDELGV
uniref:CCR4-NOT transcription complex subunit 3 n=1 Tax=Araucaria cunninghamii TaxID=56994 RepID=A0A0D6QUV9_ARACU